MFKKIYNKYLLAILGGLILTHIGYSYILGLVTSYIYDGFMPNIRNYEGKERYRFSSAYLTEKIRGSTKPILLILGSSFSYGYGLTLDNNFTNYLRKKMKSYSILNASIIGDSGDLMLANLKFLKSKKLFVDTLIIEVNLFNFTSSNFVITKSEIPIAADNPLTIDSLITSFSSFYLFYPHGMDSILNLELGDRYAFGTQSEHIYQFLSLPENYVESYEQFKKKFPIYTSELTSILSLASDVAKHVYFFVSPIYKEGILQNGFKLVDLEKQINDINLICKQFSKAHCLNLGIQENEKIFLNLSHFNEEGHRFLANWMSKQLTP
ncbi:hypothetical protein [Legionella cardiaca]|uniref:SGNH/GDSL hydrolase family protein n=1 Tax=Legionella cardiaca TaxID=1071983 RepID=A0ABY8AN58_9GAMM|nr:hypothetical protein [Legionella cardiaca]WED41894.1 hypothetical protein PXX05_08090 [Legionella cardiaca]